NQVVASAITEESCLIRGTHSQKGRTRWLNPLNAAVRHLHYGRIILGADDVPLEFATDSHETGLICLRGRAELETGGNRFDMGKYDALYVPRDLVIRVIPLDEGCDFAEISAPVANAYPLQFVPFASVRPNPSLHFQAGG